MKFIIAGPLPNSVKSGGVAVFDLNIAKELIRMGNDVTIYTSGHIEQVDGINVKHISKGFFVTKKDADIIISSLWYSLFFLFTKNIKTIHLLHGFTSLKNYRFFKFIGMILFDKIVRKRFDKVVANSNFTDFINEEIFHLNVDGTFNIGIDDNEIDDYKDSHVYEKNEILYLGRLVAAKNVDLIINAFSHSKVHKITKLNIVGYGEQQKHLEELAKNNQQIVFQGKIEHKKVANLYKKSKVFISLNPAEPYGITYVEALLANNYVIAPNTGGQVELLRKFPDRVSLVNINDIQSISDAINAAYNSQIADVFETYDIEQFSYKKTVEEILKNVDL